MTEVSFLLWAQLSSGSRLWNLPATWKGDEKQIENKEQEERIQNIIQHYAKPALVKLPP